MASCLGLCGTREKGFGGLGFGLWMFRVLDFGGLGALGFWARAMVQAGAQGRGGSTGLSTQVLILT